MLPHDSCCGPRACFNMLSSLFPSAHLLSAHLLLSPPSPFSLQLSAVRMRVTSLEGELNQVKAVQEATEKDFNRVSTELAAVRDQVVVSARSVRGVGGCCLLLDS